MKVSFSLKAILILIVYIFSGLAITIFLMLDNNLPISKNYLPLLSLCFSIGCLSFINIFSSIFKNKAIFIVMTTYYVRMVILPFFMSFSNYKRDGILIDPSSTFNQAIVLMIFEFIMVMVVIALNFTKFNSDYSNINIFRPDSINLFSNGYRKFKVALTMVTLYIIAAIIMYPQILDNYKFFVFLNEDQSIRWYINYNLAKESVPLLIFYTSTWAINITKNLWILVLIIWSYKSKYKLVSLLFSIIIIMINALISSGDTAYSLYFSLAFLLILIYLYPMKKRLIVGFCFITTISVGVLGLLFISLTSSSSSTNLLHSISNTVQAYFNGPINVASSLLIDNKNFISIMVADFFTSLPLLRTYFTNMVNSTNLFNETLYGNGGVGGKFCHQSV